MPGSILELKAGEGINLSGNVSEGSISISSNLSKNNPLPVERGGTGVSNLGNNIDELKNALVAAIGNSGGTVSLGSTTIVGGELVINKKVYITSSGPWTAPKTGVYKIHAVGGGACDEYQRYIIGSSGLSCEQFVYLKKNDVLNITIGAGAKKDIHLNLGGNTTITGTGINIHALGGIPYHNLNQANTSVTCIKNVIESTNAIGGRSGISSFNSIGYSIRDAENGKVSIEWFEE